MKRSSETSRYRYGKCLGDSCSKARAKEIQQIPVRKDFVCEECGRPLSECKRPLTAWEKYGKYVYALIGIAVVAAGIFFGMQECSKTEVEPQEPKLVSVDTITVDQSIYEVRTYQQDQDIYRDSILIGEIAVAPTRELILTDTVTVDTLIYEVKVYRQGEDLIRDSVVIDHVKKPEPEAVPVKVATEAKPTISVPFGKYSGPANGLDGEITVTRAYTLDLRNENHDKIELLPGDRITRTKFKDGQLVSGYWQRGSEKRAFHR